MSLTRSRWLQLALGIICMVMIANLQYGWTLFVLPINQAHHWGRAAIQVAFTAFVLSETWLLPIEGWLVDRLGVRPVVLAGGVLVGVSWVIDAYANTLEALYVAAVLGGVGAGAIYGATVGSALKWFPDRRGLAAGLTAAGFGAGSALTVVPIANWIEANGYESAFLFFGLVQGGAVVLVSLLLRDAPARGEAPTAGAGEADLAPTRVLRLPVFYLLYLMFVLVAAGGLMATAQLAVVANDYGVAKTPVTLAFLTMPALTFALSIDRVLNGITRPFFGWLSDQIGRERTMLIAFTAEGLGILGLVAYAHHPVAFVVLSGAVFFAWGEIFSLFPATCADLFGRTHATTNYGMLYTAKGTAALLVPLGSVLRATTGSWTAVFYVASAMNILAAVLAIAALLPLRRHMQAHFSRFGGPSTMTAFEDVM